MTYTVETEKQEVEEVFKTPSGNPDQKWKQVESIRCDTYEEAALTKQQYLDKAGTNGRAKIRRRPAGHFDVVIYEALERPEPKKKAKRRRKGSEEPQAEESLG